MSIEITRAQGPLPRIGSKAMGRLVTRAYNAGSFETFVDRTDACDALSWSLRLRTEAKLERGVVGRTTHGWTAQFCAVRCRGRLSPL